MSYETSFVLPVTEYEDESYNNLRRAYLILIASLLEKYLIEGNIQDYEPMVIAIEKSCYDDANDIADQELLHKDFSHPQFEHLYRTRMMRITKNLDYESEVGDEYLATQLLDGLIDPSTVSKLDNKDLCPAKNQEILDRLSTRLNQHITLKTSSLYRCHKCGHRETTIQNKQMRSLDEPSTLIITCTFCHYKWFN
jgi:DNA-directed RNA polymerase subunit M/transcription elongation factor TFIIS